MKKDKSFGFTDGDVVRLASGGPAMTVCLTRFDGAITCVWFVGGDPQSRDFYWTGLRHVSLTRRAFALFRRSGR